MSKSEFLEDTIISEKVNHLNPAFYNFLSQMADSIADEIRNPLAGIAGTISILKEDLKDHIDSDKLITIDSCIKRIDSFIEDLYLLTRPINPSFIKIHFNSFIEQVIKQYFMTHSAQYQFQAVETEIYVWADLILLQNAIVNVLDNAIDAIKSGGEINIYFEFTKLDDRNAVTMVVEDSGIGIEKNVFKKLFTPFFTTKHDGRGLGLVIARNYIMLHKGEICLESKINVGTKVNITLLKLPGRE